MGYKVKRIMMRPNGVEKQVRPSATPITTAGIYRNETDGLISLSSDGSTRYTIADKNLGATTAYNPGDTLSESNCGKFYQWGNNYGFPRTGTFTTYTTQVDASSYGPGNYYNSNHFYWYGSDPNSWDSSNNANLWGGITGTNEAMRGPCDTGFHIPSNNEWSNLYDLMITGLGLASNGITMKTYLLTPYNGRRTGGNNVNDQGSYLYIWTSTQRYNTSAYDIVAGDSGIYQAKTRTDGKSYGCAIRPFKNEAVQPDSSRTKLN